MKTATRPVYSGHFGRRHVLVDGKPLCGGGNGARAGQWQTELIDQPNCKRCPAILERHQARQLAEGSHD